MASGGRELSGFGASRGRFQGAFEVFELKLATDDRLVTNA